MSAQGKHADGIIIRDMREDDAPAVSRLQCQSFEFGARRAGFSREQIDAYFLFRGSGDAVRAHMWQHPCLVACEGSQVVGVVGIEGDEITKLYVDPSRLRRGIGTALFEAASGIIAGNGHHELRLGTIFAWTLPFYAAMGMSESGRRTVDSGFMKGAQSVLLRKALNDGGKVGSGGPG